jgi:hypothetical protein
MRRYLTALAVVVALGGAIAFSSTAAANSFAVSIGGPGFAVGYSNHGGYVAAYAPPPVYYAPAPYYRPYSPAYYPSYGPTVVYGGYYGPVHHHRYYRHW